MKSQFERQLSDYDAVFNNARYGIAQIAEPVVAYIQSAQQETGIPSN